MRLQELHDHRFLTLSGNPVDPDERLRLTKRSIDRGTEVVDTTSPFAPRLELPSFKEALDAGSGLRLRSLHKGSCSNHVNAALVF
jgi:hypothetical protein